MVTQASVHILQIRELYIRRRIEQTYFVLKVLIKLSFSMTGPFIISFGTFSGLILFIEVMFNADIPKASYKSYYWGYLSFLWVVAAYNAFLFRQLSSHGSEGQASGDLVNPRTILDEYRRQRLIKNILTGGLASLVDWWMGRKNISIYDIFKKPSDWTNFDVNHREYPILRFTKNSKSYEVRFPKSGNAKLLVRETLPNEIQYGDFREESIWRWSFLFPLVPIRFIIQIF